MTPQDLSAQQELVTKDLSTAKHLVVVGHGVELRNLNNEHQLSTFMVYDQQNNRWDTFLLPRLAGGEQGNAFLRPNELRESCPFVGTPTVLDDGTIYIAAAGGVLNRLSPVAGGGYEHSYAVLGAGESAKMLSL